MVERSGTVGWMVEGRKQTRKDGVVKRVHCRKVLSCGKRLRTDRKRTLRSVLEGRHIVKTGRDETRPGIRSGVQDVGVELCTI